MSFDSDKKWYIIHAYSGHEAKVKTLLQERIKRAGVEDRISQILLPVEDVVEIRNGKKKITSRKFFPGYLLIEMEMDENLWYLIKETASVTGFLGGNKPVPLDEAEVKRLVDRMKGSEGKPTHKVAFVEGEGVRVIDGPFANFTGSVEDVNMDKGKVKVIVSIFGRGTPVELDFPQVEKI